MTGRRLALIVANDSYENAGLRRLRSPAADAEALGRVLGDARIGDFEVEVSRNEPAHLLSARIEDFFADRGRDDVLLLHFSCHGLKDESNELYFAATNTRPERLVATAVSADLVHKCMRNSRAGGVVLLLDCCYGGAFRRGMRPRAAGDVDVLEKFKGGGRGRAVIAAAGAVEYAFEGDDLAENNAARPSIFTTALVEGLASGKADRDEDGTVTVDELYDYLYDTVRERSPRQTPERTVEMHGDLWIARSGRQRVKPQPIPDELSSALRNGNRYGRIGAVEELRTRLLSDILPVAAGAAEALTQVAAQDVEEVATRAKKALLQALPHGVPAEMRFRTGERPRVIPVSGPAIARIFSVEISQDWISATREGDGVIVAVSPRYAAEGLVTLRGAAGAVEIRVVADGRTPPATPTQPVSVTPSGNQEWMSWGVVAAAALSVVLAFPPLLRPVAGSLIGHLISVTLLWSGMAVIARRARRWLFTAMAALAAGAATTLSNDVSAVLGYSYIKSTPLYAFWLVIGVLLAAASVFRDDPRGVWLERAAAAQAVVLGVLAFVLDDGTATFAGRYGFTAVAVGLLWTTVAAVRLVPRVPS